MMPFFTFSILLRIVEIKSAPRVSVIFIELQSVSQRLD